MFVPLLTALAMLMPLNPEADQAVLREALPGWTAARIDIGGSDPRAGIGEWHGEGCQSRFTAKLVGGDHLKLTVDWAARGQKIAHEPGSTELALVGGLSDPVAGIGVYFETAANADRAFRAMTRLKAACTAQR